MVEKNKEIKVVIEKVVDKILTQKKNEKEIQKKQKINEQKKKIDEQKRIDKLKLSLHNVLKPVDWNNLNIKEAGILISKLEVLCEEQQPLQAGENKTNDGTTETTSSVITPEQQQIRNKAYSEFSQFYNTFEQKYINSGDSGVHPMYDVILKALLYDLKYPGYLKKYKTIFIKDFKTLIDENE
jgi:hypothetical protein